MNCYTMDPGCSPVPACWLLVFSSCAVQGLSSPVRPKVFDATACSYLTWAPALCVCTINTMPHELYSWEEGGGAGEEEERKQAVLWKGGGGELRHKSTS